MTIFKNVLETEIVISDDVSELRFYYNRNYPIVLIISDANKNEDTSFARFALYDDFFRADVTEDELCELDIYLERVVCRYKGIPVTISEDERFIIRELAMCDLQALLDIYENADGAIEPFYGGRDEASEYLKEYIENYYDVHGYGIWAIELKEDAYQGAVIGIVGISDKKDGPELVYALKKGFRGQGYAFDASCMALEYIFENTGFETVGVAVDSSNKKSLKLAKKLGLHYNLDIKIT